MTKKVEKAGVETSGLGIACVDFARRGFGRSGASLHLNGTPSCAGKKNTMKKLMFVATAALSGAVMAAGEITSANIVGYQEQDVGKAFKLMTPTFTTVDGKDYNLDDFIVTGMVDVDKVTCQKLDAEGQSTGLYFWWNADPDDPITYPAGWFDKNGETPAAQTLKPGEALIVQSQEDGVSFQSAGQVETEAQTITVGKAFKLIGNCTPVEIDLDKVTVQGMVDVDKVTCQKLDAEGQSTGLYFWWNADPDDPITYPAGWFDKNGETPAAQTLKAGESLIVQSQEDGVTVTIPGTAL